jgi:hypothetical protein
MIEKLYTNPSKRTVLVNFGKLFLPLKAAIEFNEENLVEAHITKIYEECQ